MAMIRKASAVRKKLHMLIYGEQGTGKSRTAMQLCYLKNADGKPFRVLYLDTENGSIDNYTEELEANGVNPDNLLIVYTQSLAGSRIISRWLPTMRILRMRMEMFIWMQMASRSVQTLWLLTPLPSSR